MNVRQGAEQPGSARRPSVLPWIIAFKAFKAVMLTALGIALLVTRHTDAVGVLFRLALAVHVPLTSKLFDRALTFALHLTDAKQLAMALAAFGYGVLMATEGVGLYLRKRWARWFTIIATSSFVPLEVYEIIREVHPVRVAILIVNVAIVVYLFRRKEIFEELAEQRALPSWRRPHARSGSRVM